MGGESIGSRFADFIYLFFILFFLRPFYYVNIYNSKKIHVFTTKKCKKNKLKFTYKNSENAREKRKIAKENARKKQESENARLKAEAEILAAGVCFFWLFCPFFALFGPF
jgi:hypothetical protein